MTTLTVDTLDLRKNELLLVAYSRKTGSWWASIGPERGNQRAIAEGTTPIEAFAEMLVDLGHRPDATQ